MDKRLSTFVYEHFGQKPKYDPLYIGVEIETEGVGLPNFGGGVSASRYWRTVQEGSLRNGGVEHVFRQPVGLKHLDPAFKEWDENTIGFSTFYDSIRTSVHIHLNAQYFTLGQIYSILAAYWLVENVLVQLNGDTRVGNLFCLRVKDAEYTCQSTISDIKRGRYFHDLSSDGFRYSALNLAALRKFGSLEFRFLRGYHQSHEIKKWVRELYTLVESAGKLSSPSGILHLYRNSTCNAFLEAFFSIEFISEIYRRLGNHRVGTMLEENILYVERLVRAIETPQKKTKTTTIYIDEDLPQPVEEILKMEQSLLSMYNIDDPQPVSPFWTAPTPEPWENDDGN